MYLALGVILFFAGFRYEIGYDYSQYLSVYMFNSELDKWEPLFNVLVRLTRMIDFGLDSQFMFLFFSIFTVLVVYNALKKLTPHYRMGILLYLLIPSLYLNTFSIIRQGIALAILFYGLQFIAKENPDYKKYMLVAIVAFLFHYSSIFVSLVYILGVMFFQKNHSWIFYTFSILGSFFLSFAHLGKTILMYAPGHFSAYADNLGYTVSPLKILVVNVFFLFLFLQRNTFIRTKFDIYLFNSMFIGLIIFNVFSDFWFVSRLAQYYMVAEIVLIPIYLYSIKDNMMRKILFVLFLLYYLFNFNYALYRDILGNPKEFPHTLVPYENYFFEEKKLYRTQNLEAWYNYILENTEEKEDAK